MAITGVVQPANDIRFYSFGDMRARGVSLDARSLQGVAKRAWDDIRSGRTYGLKSVLSPAEAEIWERPELEIFRKDFENERLGWKLSALSSVGPDYAAVKIVGANALNRHLGRPRSISTILLLDKISLSPLCILDGTEISAARTATYAPMVLETYLSGVTGTSVFLFGAGPVARRVVLALDLLRAGVVETVYVRSRSALSAHRLVQDLAGQVSLRLQPVEDNTTLRDCRFVITASNARAPVFEDVDTRTDAVTLHLGGDETPADHIRRVLRTGLLVCDDVAMVSRRNSQSLALYFSRMGATLEQLGPMLGVMNLKDVGSIAEGRGADPVHVTCVGLPMLDLYVAAYVYETFLQDLSGGESAAHLPMAEIAERA